MKRIVLVVMVALAWLAMASIAIADDGPMYVVGDGGSVRPMKSTTIRMAAETVQAICYSRFAEYKVDFRFENAATTQTVVLGFPFTAPPSGEDSLYWPAAGFRAWQDGSPLSVTLRHGTEDDRAMDFYTHTAVFPPGESTVTVSYLVTSYVEGWDAPENWDDDSLQPPAAYRGEWMGPAAYDYTLHTGSYWAGNIGSAVLRWTLADDFIGWGIKDATRMASVVDTSDPEWALLPAMKLRSRIQSNYATPTPNSYEWVFRNVEPSLRDGFSAYDIGLQFLEPSPEHEEDAPDSFVDPKTHASSYLKLGDFTYPSSNLVDGDPATAWAESTPGPGIGQWVDVTFRTEQNVGELRILPGYAKRPDLFKKYNRPKRLRFDFSDGTSQTVTLADEPSLQRFPASAHAKKARMTILDVYRGTTRNETYVSEVEFGTAAAPAFEDPGTLLAEARDRPSADATPAARPKSQMATAPAAAATRHGSSAEGALPLVLALLGGAVLGGVALTMFARSPRPLEADSTPDA